MNWRLLTWKDMLGIALAVALAGGLFFYYVVHPNFGRPLRLDANFGFGSDWSCTDPGKGDPVCVKKQPPN
jgi:hypothetical protein